MIQEHRREINNEDIPHWNHRSINQNDKDFTHLLFRNVVKNEFNNETYSDSNKDEYTNMDIGLYPRGKITNWNGPLLPKIGYNDGTIEVLTANIIAENLSVQVDEDGHRQLLMDEIIYHRMNTDAFQNIEGVKTREMKTTKGYGISAYSRKMCPLTGLI